MDIKLSISPTIGAFRAFTRVSAKMQNAGKDLGALTEALDGMVGWLVQFGGVDEEAIDALDFDQLAELLKAAGAAFDLPQTKSVA